LDDSKIKAQHYKDYVETYKTKLKKDIVAQKTNEMMNFDDYDSYDYHVRMSFFDKDERSLVFDILARIDADRLLAQDLDTYDQMPERGAVKDGGYIPYDRNMPDLTIDDLTHLANSEEGQMISKYWQKITAPQNDQENPTGSTEMELAEQLQMFSNNKGQVEPIIPDSKRDKDLFLDDMTDSEAIELIKKKIKSQQTKQSFECLLDNAIKKISIHNDFGWRFNKNFRCS